MLIDLLNDRNPACDVTDVQYSTVCNHTITNEGLKGLDLEKGSRIQSESVRSWLLHQREGRGVIYSQQGFESHVPETRGLSLGLGFVLEAR